MKKVLLSASILTIILLSGAAYGESMAGVGARVGAIKFKQADGKETTLSKIKGKNIAVVAFWAPQSSTVKKEVKKLDEFIQKQGGGTALILVSRGKTAEDKAADTKAAQEAGIKSNIYFDPELAAAKSLDVKSVPWFIAVGSDDTVMAPGFNSLGTKFRNTTASQMFSKLKKGEKIPYYEFVPAKEGDKTRELIGKTAPGFDSRDLKNGAQSLDRYKGKKPILAVFWRESCPHCRKELPRLAKFHLKYKDRMSFELIGFAITGKPEDVQKSKNYVSEQMITFPIVIDEGGKISDKYNISSVPTIFVIDRKGVVREVQTGEVEELDKLLVSFLEM